VVLFVKQRELITVRELLKMFGEASGLKANHAKSTDTVIDGEAPDKALLQKVLRCQPAEFPTKYLDLQLALRPLTKAEWQPPLDRVLESIPT
jgi:hypothetical protein